jgi:poly(A) polymerase
MAKNLKEKFAKLAKHPQLSFLKVVFTKLPTAEWFLVGGAVRDVLLERLNAQNHDFDLVVRGVGLDEVSEVLARFGQIDYVGRNFGVLKFRAVDWPAEMPAIDIAWPRLERSGGSGARRDFIVQADPDLPLVDDLSRRDFTINALAWDFRQKQLLDPFSGSADIKASLIRAVGRPEERFREDYSRLLRAIRFACELDFKIEEQTWEALLQRAKHINDVQEIEVGQFERIVPYEILAPEFLQAFRVSAGQAIDLLEQSGILFQLLPELERLVGLNQISEWHTEGDVWQHTKLALKKISGVEFTERFPTEQPAPETLLAVLLHDVGKADTLSFSNGRATFHGHDLKGAELAGVIMRRLRLSSVSRFRFSTERVEWLVRSHLFPILLDLEHVRKTTLSRYFLANEEAGRQLLHLYFADLSASIPSSGQPDLRKLECLVKEVDDLKLKYATEPKKLLSGDEIMSETNLVSGPKIGRLLEELREAQLLGEIENEEQAKNFLRRKITDWSSSE